MSITSSLAARPLTLRCSFSASPIWSPMVWTGDSEVIGSWKMIEIAPPRTWRITGPLRGCCAISMMPEPLPFCVPVRSNRICPAEMRAILGRMPMMACATTDLPDPDSPTSATVLPCGTRKLMPRTASSTPVSRSNAILRSRTVSRLPPIEPPGAGSGVTRHDAAARAGPSASRSRRDAKRGEIVRRHPVHHESVFLGGPGGAGRDLGEARQVGFDLDLAAGSSLGLEGQGHPALLAAARGRIIAQRQLAEVAPANGLSPEAPAFDPLFRHAETRHILRDGGHRVDGEQDGQSHEKPRQLIMPFDCDEDHKTEDSARDPSGIVPDEGRERVSQLGH